MAPIAPLQLPQLSYMQRSFELPMTVPPGMDLTTTDEDLTACSINEPLDPTIAKGAGTSSSEVSGIELLTLTQSIHYSPTWRVPVLWLQAHRSSNGSPLTLEELLTSDCPVFHDARHASTGGQQTLFPLMQQRGHTTQAEEQTGDALSEEEDVKTEETTGRMAYFPPLSTSDHPVTGLPAICLHPCQTATVIGEMLASSTEATRWSTMSESSETAEGGQQRAGDRVDDDSYARQYLEAFMTLCASAVEMRSS